MRTNIVLDDDLVAEAMALTGLRTKRAVIQEALEQLVRQHRRRDLAELRGRVRFAPDFDHKKLREETP
jgi:Arc/MetJ family transcription regulator